MNQQSDIRTIIAAVAIAGMGIVAINPSPAYGQKIWYAQPATKWMEAIPAGNGRIGAMIYGGINKETIALSEITLWSGQPDSTSNNLCGARNLAEMRESFFNNDPERGNELGTEYLTGRMTTFGTNLPLGDLKIEFHNPSTYITDYRRELNLADATTTVSYTCGDVKFKRQYIVDYPDDLLAIHLTASEPGQITMNMGLDLLREAEVSAHDAALTFNGKVDFPMHGPGGVNFYGNATVIADGGTVTCTDGHVAVNGADEVTILMDIRTDYAGKDYKERCNATITRAKVSGWESLLAAHRADYTGLYGRMDIRLGESGNSGLPTDTRLRLVSQGVSDPDFDALFFQYGRYMLIASSRDNGTPLCANLQGIWNDNGACNMPWTCDYHLDINIAQNYWAANRANLAECNEPLFKYIGLLADAGKDTAQRMYGCRGWVAHTVANAWGYTAPGWGVSWGMNVTGGAWLATHLWSHYLYTRDNDYLKTTAYPLLKSCAEFFRDYMVTDPRNGYLVTGPSISPENGYVSPKGNHLSLDMMPTIDRVIVNDIYTACIESSRILGIDSKFRRQLEKDIKRLPPLTIGSDGQVQEWLGDVVRSDPSHRHSSHLLSLFPSSQISPDRTPELAKAARIGLGIQTSDPNWEDTEWSTANMMCFYARLKDGTTAHDWLQNLFRTFTRDNLMTVSPAGVAMAETDIFSFDATEASVAAMCEMLLQSYDGCLEFLPALPRQWNTGKVRGICAEGALSVDMEWKDGTLTEATVHAGKDCKFRIKGNPAPISLRQGESYRITANNN